MGELDGAAAGPEALDALDAEAVDAYDRAIELSGNPTERDFLERQRAQVGS